MYLRQSHVQCIPMTPGEKDFKKTPVRRTNTFQSISPRAAVFHVPFTCSDPLLIPTPFVCLPIFVGRAISPGYFSISFDEHLRSILPAPCHPILNDINPISFYYLAYLRRSMVYVRQEHDVVTQNPVERPLGTRARHRLLRGKRNREGDRKRQGMVGDRREWRSGEISVARLRVARLAVSGGCPVDVIGTSG